ncbi:MAG: M23 family metallopeptidase [Limisphaerales bacterium]
MKVVDDDVDDGLALFVENRNLAAITLTVTVFPENANVDQPMPIVLTCRGRGRFPLARLTPRAGAESYSYRVRYDWQFGLGGAKHDPAAVYHLPFASGKAFRVDQGAGGKFTHTGNDQNAIDFGMPEGTPIRAAREGTVEVVVDRFDRGGADLSLRESVNFILIRHPDGTYGEYVHLRRGGARVKPGQKVTAKQVLGESGNTGYTQGPHLHFGVFSPVDGTKRDTFPIPFRTTRNKAEVLVEGETYQAP